MSQSITDIKTKENDEKVDEEKNKGFSFKSYALLLLLFMLVTSDIFNETVLSCVPSATEGRDATMTGAIISGIILCIAHAVIINNM
uniref:Uncharacterized protein n=1 Tax=viral metagenome TaxID=1070528 RepID=A0A6C0LJQ4_9ZZZZ